MAPPEDPDSSPDVHPVPTDDVTPADRARALQSLLVEKELLSTDAVDEVLAAYEEEIGPMNGAEVVARAWTDATYREWLLDDGTAAIADVGYTGVQGVDIEVVENTPDRHNVVVCTLCSCYPWPVLGLPPTWYKAPPYRSKIVKRPRATLREEFDVPLADDTEIRVWDSTSEIRYMVLPQQPPETADMDRTALTDIVTRDSMIGVDRLAGAAAADGGQVTVDHPCGANEKGVGAVRAALQPPADDGGLVFTAPWQARLFALLVRLRTRGHLSLPQLSDLPGDRSPATPDPRSYYEDLLVASERLFRDEGLLAATALVSRAAAFARGDRDAAEFVRGGTQNDHGHKHSDTRDPPSQPAPAEPIARDPGTGSG